MFDIEEDRLRTVGTIVGEHGDEVDTWYAVVDTDEPVKVSRATLQLAGIEVRVNELFEAEINIAARSAGEVYPADFIAIEQPKIEDIIPTAMYQQLN